MPFKSVQQEKWAYTPAGTRALGGKAKVAEWQSATNQKALPEKAPKKKGALGSR
jgi:hypothetical protein